MENACNIFALISFIAASLVLFAIFISISVTTMSSILDYKKDLIKYKLYKEELNKEGRKDIS